MIEVAYLNSDSEPILCYRFIAWGNSQWSEWKPVRTFVVTDAEFEQINLKGKS